MLLQTKVFVLQQPLMQIETLNLNAVDMKDKTEDLSSQDRHRSSSVLPVVVCLLLTRLTLKLAWLS